MLKLNDIAFVKVFTVQISKSASWLKLNIKPFNIFLGFILTTISIGIWAQVLQNAGIIKTVQKVKVVYPVDVRDPVEIKGTVTIDKIEQTVEIDGTVEVKTYSPPSSNHIILTNEERAYLKKLQANKKQTNTK